jgi:Protein of unknown function (DUF1573)
MSKIRTIPVLILSSGAVLGVLLAARCYYGDKNTQAAPPPVWLTVAGEELNLGDVYESASHEHVLHIRNASERPATIRWFERTCDCTEVPPDRDLILQPGETRAFTFHLTPRPQDKAAEPGKPEPRSIQLGATYVLEGDPTPRRAEWQVSCVLQPTIRFMPFEIDFGTISDRQLAIERSLDIAAAENIDQIEGEAPPNWGVEIQRQSGGSPGKKFKATFRSRGKPTLGRGSEVIRLYPVDGAGKRLPAKEFKLGGEIVVDVLPFPREIHYGRQPCGTAAVEVIQLRSLLNRQFFVKSAVSDGEDLTITTAGSGTDDRLFSVRLRFAQPGNQERFVKFAIEDQDRTEYDLLLPVRYCGVCDP